VIIEQTTAGCQWIALSHWQPVIEGNERGSETP
jgi:hypothetical protein